MDISKITYTVEALLNQFSWEFDRSLEKQEKMRRLKCGFCNCLYKYQVCLNHHVITKHMVDLKNLSDFERRSFILLYLEPQDLRTIEILPMLSFITNILPRKRIFPITWIIDTIK